jgi:dTDP-4-amino-4,6-dideoxygalactose transaminase
MIPFNRAHFAEHDYAYLFEAVSKGHVSGNGPFTKRSEKILSRMHGGVRALLTTSCTHALELAANLLDFQPGDEVILPSFTFVSTANAFLLAGAKPVFVDIDVQTLGLTLENVQAAITPRTRAVCIVHYGGVAQGLIQLRELCDKNGLFLVEDNAHGLRCQENETLLGTVGQMSTLSFHETKNITCGEGGALILNDERFVERAEIMREKGTNRSKFFRGQVDKYTWVDRGSSWVQSDILAALLTGQLERFEQIHERRHEIWSEYAKQLVEWAGKNHVSLPNIPSQVRHQAHVFFLLFDFVDHRDKFIQWMKEAEITTVFHYQPLHLSPMGLKYGGRVGQCPITENIAERIVRLPLYFDLTQSEQAKVIDRIQDFKVGEGCVRT